MLGSATIDRAPGESITTSFAVAVLLETCCLVSFLVRPVFAETGSPGYFSERAETLGLHFVHNNGMSGKFYLVEIMGPGAALFDYDNDGDLDAYLVQGGALGPENPDANTQRIHRSSKAADRLFRNDLVVGNDATRRLNFVDVTDASQIDASGYGMSVASGDFDNDGWLDLFAANGEVSLIRAPATAADPFPLHQTNQLFRNRNGKVFQEVTKNGGKPFGILHFSDYTFRRIEPLL